MRPHYAAIEELKKRRAKSAAFKAQPVKPKKALRKDGANDRTLARDGKRTQVNPAILKDKSTNKPILQQDSRTSDKITAAATGVGDKRAREIDDAAGQPKVKYRKVEPKRCSSFFENLQRTVNQSRRVPPPAPNASVKPKTGQLGTAVNQGKDEAKVPDTPRPTLKIKLKLPTKLSNVNTTSPQGAVKKHDINAKAGHVTDPVSDSVSSGKKEARLQAPPATKRSAETGVDEKPHKKRRISPKLPHSKSSPASSHATDTVGESKPSLMKEGTAHAPPTKKRSAEAAVDDKPDKKRKLNPELPESKSEPANVLQGRINRSKPVGLRNNGKCCYSNSTLQCLLQTPPIRKYCIAKGDSFVDPFTSDKVTIEDVAAYSKHSTRRGTRAKANLTSQFKEVNPNDVKMSGHIGKLFSKMYYENDDNAEATSVSPTVFNQAHGRIHPDFDGSMQQDPADFLRQVLEHLDEEDRVTAYPQSGEKSVVESTIQGQLSVTRECTKCKEQSPEMVEPFNLLGLTLPQKARTKEGIWTLKDCLDELKKQKTIEDFMCEKCSTAESASYTVKTSSVVKTAPDYLALQILRMAYEIVYDGNGKPKGFSSRKLTDTVQYPETMDLAPWTADSTEQVYDLYSVIEHKGGGLEDGHYVATVKCGTNWTHFDDSFTESWDPEQVLGVNPYLLFYRKRELGSTS